MKRKPFFGTPVETFCHYANKSNGCWEWKGSKDLSGYGVLSYKGKQFRAHRLSVKLSGRKVPTNMFVDHICRNHSCVNPGHLRVVTPRVNVLENSAAPSAINAKKTHCNRGHEFTTENTKTKNGRRECRICSRLTAKKWRRKNLKDPSYKARMRQEEKARFKKRYDSDPIFRNRVLSYYRKRYAKGLVRRYG